MCVDRSKPAYRVLVASSAAKLAADEADLWEPERWPAIRRSMSFIRATAAKTRMQCFWKVLVGTRTGSCRNRMNRLRGRWAFEAGRLAGQVDCSPRQSAADAAQRLSQRVCDDGRCGPMGGGRSGRGTQDRRRAALSDASYDWQPDTPASCSPCGIRSRLAGGRLLGMRRTVVDQSGADVPNPGLKVLAYPFKPISARYVRLNVSRLAHRDASNYAFALAEMQVLLDETLGQGRDGPRIEFDRGGRLGEGQVGRRPRTARPRRRGTTSLSGRQPMLRKEFDVPQPIKRAVVTVTGLDCTNCASTAAGSGIICLPPSGPATLIAFSIKPMT